MLSETELLYTLALQRVPNLGDASAKKLLRYVGSSEAIFRSDKRQLLQIDGIGPYRIKELKNPQLLRAAERELKYIQNQKIDATYFLDPHYPERLTHCIDGPILLFSKGAIPWNNQRVLSVVGTRRATAHGKEFCETLIEELSPLEPTIISGFAYGIDIIAHRAALKYGLPTIACLAHGFQHLYPRAHKKYVAAMCEHGGLLTEFWSDDPFERTNFLRRNRIIAGLSEATIIIESADKGGSLVTADIAHSYGRELFAVPGRVSDTQSSGCHRLIKSQRAHLLTTAADVIYVLGWDLEPSAPAPAQTTLFEVLEPQEQQLYDFLVNQGKVHLDTLVHSCELSPSSIAPLLLQLELKGRVRPLPGKFFQAC